MSRRLMEFARVGDAEKARELVHATAHQDDQKERLDSLLNSSDRYIIFLVLFFVRKGGKRAEETRHLLLDLCDRWMSCLFFSFCSKKKRKKDSIRWLTYVKGLPLSFSFYWQHKFTQVHICACMCVCACVCKRVCVCACVHVCVFMCKLLWNVPW